MSANKLTLAQQLEHGYTHHCYSHISSHATAAQQRPPQGPLTHGIYHLGLSQKMLQAPDTSQPRSIRTKSLQTLCVWCVPGVAWKIISSSREKNQAALHGNSFTPITSALKRLGDGSVIKRLPSKHWELKFTSTRTHEKKIRRQQHVPIPSAV